MVLHSVLIKFLELQELHYIHNCFDFLKKEEYHENNSKNLPLPQIFEDVAEILSIRSSFPCFFFLDFGVGIDGFCGLLIDIFSASYNFRHELDSFFDLIEVLLK